MSQISAFSIQNCITRAFLIFRSSVCVLYPGTQGFGGIAQAKYQMFLLLCGGYTALMLLLLAESALVSGKKCRNLKVVLKETNWTQRFLALYLLFTWLSALLSPYFPETVIGVSRYEGALTISIYVVCFFLVRAYGRIDRVLITVFGAAVTLFDLLCIAQLYGGNPFTLYPVGYGYADAGVAYSGAYLGTIGNVDLVAAFFCLAIPAFWAAMLRSRDWQRWLLSVPLALSLFVLVKMNVLAGFVGVFAGGAIGYVVIAPVGETHRRALAAAFFCLVVGSLAALYCVDFGGVFHELHSIMHGEISTTFGSGRIHIWEQVLSAVPEHFLLGTGPDTMLYGGLEAFTRYDEALGGTIVAQIDVAHNEYLNILYHQGIFALAAYLGALAAAAKKWLRDGGRNALVAVLGTMLLCYSIQAFFGFSMIMTAPYFYLTLALFDKSDV